MLIVLCFTSTAIENKKKKKKDVSGNLLQCFALVFQLKRLRSKHALMELAVSHPEMQRLKSSKMQNTAKSQQIAAAEVHF